jgi:hypothetical protein
MEEKVLALGKDAGERGVAGAKALGELGREACVRKQSG